MKRLIDRIRSLYAPFAIGLLLLTAAFRADAQLYCNNPVAPCNPDDPQSVCYRPASPSPRCEPKECGKCTKSPCYVGSGVYSTEATDLEIRTVGFPISVSRLYESSRAVDGEMGVGWVTGLSARIYLTMVLKDTLAEGDNEAYVRLPSGTLYRFVEDAFGNYVPPPGRFDRLIHNADGTWELRLQRTRSVYRYAATGELTGMTDDSGNSLVWSYEKGRLTRIAYNPGGDPKSLGLRYVELTWGSDGRLSDVTDHTGRSVHYDYDSAGRLAGVTNPLGQSTRYEYAAGRSGPLLRAIDDHWNRNVTTVTYDANDRVKTYTDRGETYTYTYAYQGQSRVTAKSDSSGNTRVYTFTPEGLVTDIQPPGGGASEHVDYDGNGLPVLEIDATGVKTRYEYDARGNFATVTRDYQGPTAVEWRFAYHPDFPDEPVSILPYSPSTGQISPDWQGVRFEYHPLGSVSEGLLQRLYAVDAGGATARLVAAFTWDSQGRLHTETDAGGNVRTETYGELGERTILMPANNDAGTRPVIR
ncbi:MAG TPA: DUF6531 domain-containing protein, partial [Thermoanaerobaculia bacterium]|nr:DUF6531 domain-containing protein [Thermoanaerobaculia bacterium]